MLKSVLVAIVFAAIVSAQSIVSLTSPLNGNVFTAGGQIHIAWVNPTVDVIPQILLSQGSATALQPIMNIASNVPAKNGEYNWNIPATIAPGTDYAIVLGTAPNLSYSSFFTIKAAQGLAAISSSAASGPNSPAPSPSTSSALDFASASPLATGLASPAAGGYSEVASPAKSSSAASSQSTSAAGKMASVSISAIAVVGAAVVALTYMAPIEI